MHNPLYSYPLKQVECFFQYCCSQVSETSFTINIIQESILKMLQAEKMNKMSVNIGYQSLQNM